MTTSRRCTVWSGPELATGDAKSPTPTVTSGLVVDAAAGFGFCVSVTVTRNFNVVPAIGAENVGFCAVVLESVTGVPAVCAHR